MNSLLISDKDLVCKNVSKRSSKALMYYLVDRFNYSLSGRNHIPLNTRDTGRLFWQTFHNGKYRDFAEVGYQNYSVTTRTIQKYKKQDALLQFWDYLSLVGAKDIGGISDVGKHSDFYPAKRFHSLLVVKNNGLYWGSIDRLKNTTVWRYNKDFVETKK